jgi:hypothetical protein
LALRRIRKNGRKRLHADSIVIDLLSQHAGGTIFDHYPAALQARFQAEIAAAGGGLTSLIKTLYWPHEQSLTGQSHLIKDWYREAGLSCGSYGIMVHDGTDPFALAWESHTSRYGALPWSRYVTTAEEIRAAKRDGVIAFYANQ